MSEEQVASEQTNTEVAEEATPVPFIETLPEGLRESDHLKGMETPEQLAQDYVNLKAAAPVIPESPDGYQLVFDEGMEIDNEVLSGFKGKAHELRLTNDQAQSLANFHNEVLTNANNKHIEARNNEGEASISALKKEFGATFEAEMAFIEKAKQFMTEDLKADLEETGFGNNVNLARFMHKVGKAISEDTLVEGEQKPSHPVDDTGKRILDFPSMNK
jgi:hypothetical protein